VGEEAEVKIDGVYISPNTREYIQLLEQLGRDEEATHDLPLSAPEAVQEITAVAREQVAEVDTYRPNGAGLLLDCPKAPVLICTSHYQD
jgi:hypothetical protein